MANIGQCPFCGSKNLKAVIYNEPGNDTGIFDSSNEDPQYFDGPVLAISCEHGVLHTFWAKTDDVEGIPVTDFVRPPRQSQ